MSAQPLATPAPSTAPPSTAPPRTPARPHRSTGPQRSTGSQRLPAGATGSPKQRTRLRLVPPSRRAPRAPFVAVLLALLLVGLVGLLVLNTASAQDAFRLSSLQTAQETLALQRQELAQQAATLSDPAQLEARALQLGMVPIGAPQFLAPGQPFPKGAVLLGNGMVVVLAPVQAPAVSIEAAPASPDVAAPGAKAKASAKPSMKASLKPSTKASLKALATPSAKPSVRASVKPSARSSAKAAVAPPVTRP